MSLVKKICKRYAPIEKQIEPLDLNDPTFKRSLVNAHVWDSEKWLYAYRNIKPEQLDDLKKYYYSRLARSHASVLNLADAKSLIDYLPIFSHYEPLSDKKTGHLLSKIAIQHMAHQIRHHRSTSDSLELTLRCQHIHSDVAYALADSILNGFLINIKSEHYSEHNYDSFFKDDMFVCTRLSTYLPVFELLLKYIPDPVLQDKIQLKLLCLNGDLFVMHKIKHLQKYNSAIELLSQKSTIHELFQIIDQLTTKELKYSTDIPSLEF